jgi:flagellar biosynthesis chaperone FliJ
MMSFLLYSNVPEVIDIKSVKKKQNEIKTLTSTFIKLLNNWSQVTSQIDALLHNLSILISTVESVQRMECRYPQRFPLFEELFTDTYSMLTGRIYSEIETVYQQLKHYMYVLFYSSELLR